MKQSSTAPLCPLSFCYKNFWSRRQKQPPIGSESAGRSEPRRGCVKQMRGQYACRHQPVRSRPSGLDDLKLNDRSCQYSSRLSLLTCTFTSRTRMDFKVDLCSDHTKVYVNGRDIDLNGQKYYLNERKIAKRSQRFSPAVYSL